MAALSGLTTPVLVQAERRHRLDATEVPAVLVSTTEDATQPGERSMGTGPYDMETDQNISIELHAQGTDGETVAETLDQLDLEVEQALAADISLGGILEILTQSESAVEFNADQDVVLGVRVVTYVATWRHTFGDADTPEG
jgi:hypothetical protein